MDVIPKEVLVRHAASEVGKYFADKVETERRNGKVAVLVEDFTHSLYFLNCDDNGYPRDYMFKCVTLDPVSIISLSQNVVPSYQTVTTEEITIVLDRPLLTGRYDYRERPAVFLWLGKKMNRDKIPIEKLNVSELMKLAQQAIINREGLVIDEALKNKIYK